MLGSGGGDGVLLGERVPGVDGVVRVDRVQPHLRGRPQEQGTKIMTFSIIYSLDSQIEVLGY